MKFVIDTNILFTFFWNDSFTKGILIDQDFQFFSPEYALHEINSHKEEILGKTKITDKKFDELKHDLAICVEFIPTEEYKEYLKEALSLIPKHKDDADFLALALKLKLPIWSNDSHLKEQSKIKIRTTKEFIDLLKEQATKVRVFPKEKKLNKSIYFLNAGGKIRTLQNL